MSLKSIIKYTSGLLAVVVACPASASPRPLPFTYPYETLDKGELELELYGDMTPLRVEADPPAKGRLWEPAYQLQNEFEYGLTDRIELGFYQVFEAQPAGNGSNAMTFDGFKWRVRGRLAEAGQWPVDVALYLELETLHDETSLEEKIILGKRFGRLHWMANLWVEESEERPLDSDARSFHFVINPTTGAFSSVFTTSALGVGASPYTISYSYAGSTDFAPAMVARAEAKAIPGATFRVGDAVAQPVSDGQFDGVTCQLSISRDASGQRRKEEERRDRELGCSANRV